MRLRRIPSANLEDYSCSKNSRVQAPCERPAANKIRVIRAIRVRIKYRDKSVWKNIRDIRIIRVQKSSVQAPRERKHSN